MPTPRQAKRALDKMLGEDGATATLYHNDEKVAEFGLEAPTPGAPSEYVIAELRRCYREAKDYTGAFAIKVQAEKHKLKPAALRRYVAALEGDKVADAAQEASDLEMLIEGAEA